MATFRFTFEFGTDDATLPVGEALDHVDTLREWLAHYPIRKYGTVFVSEVEINPVAWDTGYEAIVLQGGFPVLDAANAAEALYRVFDHRPSVSLLEHTDQGTWNIPLPITVMSDLLTGRSEWVSGDIIVSLLDC